MIVILAIDALEYECVKKFDCKNLMQVCYGKTDITDFEQPRTIVLWSSFLTGRNMEKEILSKGDMWNTKIETKDTFLSKFKKFKVIDLPGYNYDRDNHAKERELMKKFFDKQITVEEYEKIPLEHYKKVKEEFLKSLDEDLDILIGYFGVIDVIGHVSFGLEAKMKVFYKEMDEIARKVKEKINGNIIILSDHGMKAIGRFGDHSEYGFWSFNKESELSDPKITDFFNVINDLTS